MSKELVRRLRAEEPIGMLSGCMDTVRLINPDGPEAADCICDLRGEVFEQATRIEALERDLAARSDVVEALREMLACTMGAKVGGGDGGTYVVHAPSGKALNRAMAALAALDHSA